MVFGQLLSALKVIPDQWDEKNGVIKFGDKSSRPKLSIKKSCDCSSPESTNASSKWQYGLELANDN